MLTALALMTLSFPASYTPVQASACSRVQNFTPKYVVHVDLKPVEYKRDVIVHQLHNQMYEKLYEWQKENKQSQYLGDAKPIEKWTVSGSSKANVTSTLDVDYLNLPYDMRTNLYCTFFKEVNITISYQTVTTIAKELEEGSCRYKIIREHEEKHDEANKTVTTSVVQSLEQDLTRIVQSIEGTPIREGLIYQEMAEMEKKLKAALSIYEEDIMGLIGEYNKMLDTPEEFRRIANTCQDE